MACGACRGGYVDRGEVVEEAAVREVEEETGLVVQVDGLVGLFSEAEHPVVVVAYVAYEVGGHLNAGHEALAHISHMAEYPSE